MPGRLSYTASNELAMKIADVIGIDGAHIQKMVIVMEPHMPVEVIVTTLLDSEQDHALQEVVTKYKLAPT